MAARALTRTTVEADSEACRLSLAYRISGIPVIMEDCLDRNSYPPVVVVILRYY